jgi:hypothetical protein
MCFEEFGKDNTLKKLKFDFDNLEKLLKKGMNQSTRKKAEIGII